MERSTIAYIYDGSFEGLLSAVFTAFERREQPYIIAQEENLQVIFGQEVVRVRTDPVLAGRVTDGVRKKMGADAYGQIWTAFLSCDADRATKIYRYIRVGMKIGRAVTSYLSNEDVLAVVNICKYVGGEAHLLKGFVRFTKMDNGVYYAKITPNNNVIPVLMPHFSDRYTDQPFLIHDPGHQLVGAYDLKEWYLIETDHIDLPGMAADEADWKRLWKRFYNAIAIAERTNHKLRMNHMPKRYWPNIDEMR
ncbi:MAG: TIGR03915 family putative DNA repair protein [Oscillospiraceae bacterium]|jgi:probable DNA metabolism protein|nr:TIGR03915 family putative DNA repair protein [Oscillospiraceae bacterium]